MFPKNYVKIRKTFFDSKTQISEKFQMFLWKGISLQQSVIL